MALLTRELGWMGNPHQPGSFVNKAMLTSHHKDVTGKPFVPKNLPFHTRSKALAKKKKQVPKKICVPKIRSFGQPFR